MKLYPAIDLMGARCVRLVQGDFGRKTEYELTPVEAARRFEAAGARYLHVVDLDGARAGQPRQTDVIGSLCRETSLTVQAGGGLRSETDALTLFDLGAARIVLGSLAVKDPVTAKAILRKVGPERFTLALDVRTDGGGDPRVAVSGWTASGGTLWTILTEYADEGLKHLLCTDIANDGMLAGPNLGLYREVRERFPHLELQASGGVGTLSHLTSLRAAGIPGAVVGKALYEGKFSLSEALTC